MEIKDTCLYIHTRKSDGGIFYVGIGYKKRSYSKRSRNRYWRHIVNKHGFDVTILVENISWKRACDLEIKMISFYGRVDKKEGVLVNLTDGGDGAKGAVWSQESKQKRSGENNPMFGVNRSGEKNPMFGRSGEKSPRFSIIVSEETRKKISKGNMGRIVSEDTRLKKSGKNHPKSKKVICCVTGKIYSCIKEASEDIGINYGTLRGWLLGYYQNKTSLKYIDSI